MLPASMMICIAVYTDVLKFCKYFIPFSLVHRYKKADITNIAQILIWFKKMITSIIRISSIHFNTKPSMSSWISFLASLSSYFAKFHYYGEMNSVEHLINNRTKGIQSVEVRTHRFTQTPRL